MSIYSIWESRFPQEAALEGVEATHGIWGDMPSFDGYLDHEVVQDLDQPGHLFVVSRWTSREAAEAALVYLSHPNAKRVDELVSEPRRRTVAAAV
ncbi:MAG TPA: antibiotic biosynthesis monooxygenase [Solirubrobacteraceae bacterium]|nr:antibiotic biosynthesis monooxygenase [Solirubrobacteraceae bacterium]